MWMEPIATHTETVLSPAVEDDCATGAWFGTSLAPREKYRSQKMRCPLCPDLRQSSSTFPCGWLLISRNQPIEIHTMKPAKPLMNHFLFSTSLVVAMNACT